MSIKNVFENMYDAGGATKHALPIAWQVFKDEWRKEYDTRAILRGADAAKRQAERTAKAKTKPEPQTIDGEATVVTA